MAAMNVHNNIQNVEKKVGASPRGGDRSDQLPLMSNYEPAKGGVSKVHQP